MLELGLEMRSELESPDFLLALNMTWIYGLQVRIYEKPLIDWNILQSSIHSELTYCFAFMPPPFARWSALALGGRVGL